MRLSSRHLIFFAVLLAGCEPFLKTTATQPPTEPPPSLAVSSTITPQMPSASATLIVTGITPLPPRPSPSLTPLPATSVPPTANVVQPKPTLTPTVQDGSPGASPVAPTTAHGGNCMITLMMDFDGPLISDATGSPATVHIPAQTSMQAFYVVQLYEIQRPVIYVEYNGYHGLISYEYFLGSSCTPPLQVTIELAPPPAP